MANFLVGTVSERVKSCTNEYVEDASSTPPKFRYTISNSRKKRSKASSNYSDYSDCLASTVGNVVGHKPLDYSILTKVVRNYTTSKCEHCSDKCGTKKPEIPSNAPPQWPYRFLALTRSDAPLRKAIVECNIAFFPGIPFWSEWSPWSPTCVYTCPFPPSQRRSRSCRSGVDPSQQVGGSKCSGQSLEYRPFFIGFPYYACSLPNWSSWNGWSRCSNCNSRFRTRTRDCLCGIDPNLKVIKHVCSGKSSETQACKNPNCNRPAWTAWSWWTPVCPSCGRKQQQTRRRLCKTPNSPLTLPSLFCTGNRGYETRSCPFKQCPSSWGLWSKWEPECLTCGRRLKQTRSRKCYINNKPKPIAQCSGISQEERNCKSVPPCTRSRPQWSTWSTCAKDCRQTRNRYGGSCTVGSYCAEIERQSRPCDGGLCKSKGPGSWSNWGKWSTCSKACSQSRYRSYGNCPVGTKCSGKGSQSRSCNGGLCRSTRSSTSTGRFTWTAWGKWGKCSGRCTKNHRQTRRRKCLLYNTRQAVGAASCKPGKPSETMYCPCFSKWSEWSNCRVGGKCRSSRQRTRKCYLGKRQTSLRQCKGRNKDTRKCPGYCG